MDKVIKPTRNLYCPITVSDIATNNAKVRQNSLREYSHAQNAAYRAFCRGPGRPQTAAFGRVYYETRLSCPSLSPSKAELHDCITALKAMVEERCDATVNHSTRRISQPIYTERPLSRNKSARRILRHRSENSTVKDSVQINGSTQSLPISIENKVETNDSLIELDSSSEENVCDTESSEETNEITSYEDSVSDSIDGQLVVYHVVDKKCSCSTALSYHGDPVVGCETCSCNQNVLVTSYSVQMRGEGYQSTPGLGNCDSQQNKALWDLLQKQLSHLSKRQQSNDDKSHYHHLESFNVIISQLVNVKPPNGYLYYFAYGPDINTKRFMTYVHRKLFDTAWALLYGFKLVSPDNDIQGDQSGSVWPKCQYSPQSAVEGRIYVISSHEADVLDKQMSSRQGLQSVVLPVWLLDSDDNSHSTAQYCLPVLVHLPPHQLLT